MKVKRKEELKENQRELEENQRELKENQKEKGKGKGPCHQDINENEDKNTILVYKYFVIV